MPTAPVDPSEWALTSTRVLLDGALGPATIVVRDGVIARIDRNGNGTVDTDGVSKVAGVDVADRVVLPGLVDSHVHVNEPGRTHWEGFETATRAAAAGGVTTMVDMPLNCLPPTTDVPALQAKRQVAGPKAHVDVAFWGGAVPGNDDQLAALLDAGVRGFKTFLCDSGVPEYGCVHPSDVTPLLRRVAELDTTLIVHAEDPDVCDAAATAQQGADHRRYTTWLDSRPPQAEMAAVTALVEACRTTGARVHVLHLSAADAGEVLADAKAEGLPITVETCPHYLTLNAEDVPDGATQFKCAPPIRDAANADRLWSLLGDGVIDAVVSDHSPCPPGDKQPETGDFVAAWGGIASLQLGLPLIWTAARDRGHAITEVCGWMSAGPARIAGLATKGSIDVGSDADLVVFDPDGRWMVDGAALEHRHPVTPHHGREVVGRVDSVFLAGRQIVAGGRPVGAPAGRLL
ncbi:allantoinase AllB [Euzebya tangerina]|uniref:allantoinase AllB n=1 Tax=Euzebya tangerina TaxID=591198 RepID=UPI000E31B19A|nr:allantoinase AllB [Euzebya tangerina]